MARLNVLLLMLALAWGLTACAPTVAQMIPTERPTITPTFTATATRTRAPSDVTPTATQTRPPLLSTSGPSPTALLGATSTPDVRVTPTPLRSVNAPRIEFFTSDVIAVAPGTDVRLFWSTRGADGATLYRLDPDGARNQLWNVPPDGNLTVSTRLSDRGTVDFLLTVGEGTDRTEQRLSLPLSCPVTWFFVPPPAECPDREALETRIIEQSFVRGRMVYIADRNEVYVLYNDGFEPAWVVFQNRYDPAIHEERLENFIPPAGRVQPIAELGFLWRGSDTVRSRLGLGTQEPFTYTGFVQTSRRGESITLYVTSADGNVLQLLPDGSSWQIITLP